jgi:phage/plasmid-associated DNA primase
VWERPPWIDIPDDFLDFLLSYTPGKQSLRRRPERSTASSILVVGPRTPCESDAGSYSREYDVRSDASSVAYTAPSGVSASVSASMPTPPSVQGSLAQAAALDDAAFELIKQLVERCWSTDRATGYTTWLKCGLALFNAGGGTPRLLPVWLDFCKRGGAAYGGEAACRDKWASFGRVPRADGVGVGIGSIRFWAREDAPALYEELVGQRLRALVFAAARRSNDSVADVIVQRYGDRFVCTSIKLHEWYEFAGNRWSPVHEGYKLHVLMATEVARLFTAAAAECGDKADQMSEDDADAEDVEVVEDGDEGSSKGKAKANGKGAGRSALDKLKRNLTQVALQLENTHFKDTTLKACAHKLFDPRFVDRLDVADHLIGFDNGVYDVDAGVFRAGRADDFLTMSTGYDFAVDDDPVILDELQRFLASVQATPEATEYLTSVLAYSLHGFKFLETLWFFTGKSGRNGKGLTCTLMKLALGDYYYEPSSTLFTTTAKSSSCANPELAKSRGKLLMVASEPSDTGGSTLKCSTLKQWRGNDSIQARSLYKDFVSFRPKFAMILQMNDKPLMDKMDSALSKTLRVIEFPHEFVEEPALPHERLIDATLKAKFERDVRYRQQFVRLLLAHREARPRIYKEMKNIPFPAEVAAATQEYMDENNTVCTAVQEWLQECYESVTDPGQKLKATTLLAAFLESEHGKPYKATPASFKKAMESAGLTSHKSHGTMVYIGLARKGRSSFVYDGS